MKNLLHQKELARADILVLILGYNENKPKSAANVQRIAEDAGFKQIGSWNVSRELGKLAGLAVRTPQGWELIEPGVVKFAELANVRLPGSRTWQVANDLRVHLQKINNPDVAAFVAEAISSYEAKHYRAAVVLAWVGAMAVLHDHVVRSHLADFNKEAQRRDADWKTARTADDVGLMKEHDFLNVLQAISVLGKNVKQELQDLCLKLRNGCGHPNSLKIYENRVAAHIEILILNVFAVFT